MAKFFDKKSEKYAGETRVYECLQKNLPEKNILRETEKAYS